MLDEKEAKRRILDAASPGAVTWIPLELTLDQVLAQEVTGSIDSPPFDNSSMDGYAVCAAECKTGNSLQVHEEVQAAGLDCGLSLQAGEAIRIFTGAPMPTGADAVIMQEDVLREGDRITIVEGVVEGENIRRRGGDVCAGQKLLERGDVMTPARIGLLASQGLPEVAVHGKPLVQVVTTGDELVEPGAPLLPGEIYNSNSPMLQAAVTRVGGIAAASHAFDDPEELREVLGAALATADIVVIAGGVSVGEKDFVKEVLEELGVITEFWRVKIKPGKPFVFGRHPDGTLVFGLPGNPVSAFVTFHVFVAPVIRRLLGDSPEDAAAGVGQTSVVLDEAVENTGDRPHYFRGRMEGGKLRLSGTQQSHAIYGLSRANCLLRLDPGEQHEEGAAVSVISI